MHPVLVRDATSHCVGDGLSGRRFIGVLHLDGAGKRGYVRVHWERSACRGCGALVRGDKSVQFSGGQCHALVLHSGG